MQTALPCAPRAPDPYQSLPLSCARHLRIVEIVCRHDWQWEELYRVEIEAVEMPSSNVFEITVIFHWELLDDQNNNAPDPHKLIAIARQLVRDHFGNGLCPRLCGQRFGIEIHYPPSPDLPI